MKFVNDINVELVRTKYNLIEGLVPVPTYDKFIEPILRYLASRPQGAVARETQSEAQSSMTDDVTVL